MADITDMESYEADASKTVDDQGLDGIPILELYSITYLGSSVIKADDQNGSITLKTNNRRCYLYHEPKVDTSKPSIKYGDQLPMWNIGPICSFTNLKLKFDLFSGKYKGSTKVFAHSPKDGDWLAKPSIKSIDGYKTNISVLFGCFYNATVANLKVIFLPDSPFSNATTNVYGVVVASNSKFDHPSCKSYLFSQNPASTIQVGLNDVIPLSKSRVGVPLDSQLYVDISLSCDGTQYKGTAEFTPKNKKDSQRVGGQILVKVTWNYSEDLDSTDEDSDFTAEDSDFTDEDSDFTDEDSDSTDEDSDSTDEDSDCMHEFDSASDYEFGSDDIQKEILQTVT